MKMNCPNVSVIITVYNGEKYLGESIKSIITQTYDNYELIIVDDGSSDSSLEIVRSYSNQASKIKIIKNDENLGQPMSRNNAIQIARGNYIAIMDADDVAREDRLEKEVAYLDEHLNVGFVGSQAKIIDSEGRFTGEIIGNRGMTSYQLEWLELSRLYTSIIHPSVMFRKSVFEKLDVGYDPTYPYAQDKNLWLRMYTYAEAYVIPECLLYYRRHDGAVSKAKNNLQRECAELITKEAYDNLQISKEAFSKMHDSESDSYLLQRLALNRILFSVRKDKQSAIKVLAREMLRYAKHRPMRSLKQSPRITVHFLKSLLHIIRN